MIKYFIILLLLVGGWIFYKTRPIEDIAKLKGDITELIVSENEDNRYKDQSKMDDPPEIPENEIWIKGKSTTKIEEAVTKTSELIEKVLAQKGFKEVTSEQRKQWNLGTFFFTGRNSHNKKVVMANDKIMALYDIKGSSGDKVGMEIKIQYHSKKLIELVK